MKKYAINTPHPLAELQKCPLSITSEVGLDEQFICLLILLSKVLVAELGRRKKEQKLQYLNENMALVKYKS